MRIPLFLASLVVGSGLLACSALSDDAASQESAHTEGHPTYAQYKWLWADETLDEFKANASAGFSWSTPEYLPVEHPMAQRLQFWVDQMDAMLRAKMPQAMANTPKPQIILRKDDEPNAWVTYMPIAFDVPTKLARAAGPAEAGAAPEASDAGVDPDAAPAPPPPEPTVADVFMLRNTGKITSLGEASPLSRKADEKLIKEFVDFHNDGFAKCKLSYADKTIVFADGCSVEPGLGAERSKRVAFYATSKWVTVTTGLITQMLDEDRIVAVLAHELGHYYRTHASQPSDQLNYYYAIGTENAASKPPAELRFLDDTLKVRDKLRDASGWFSDYSAENKLMTDNRLGFYTTEQEADEISLEILAKMGMPPTLGPDSQLSLHKIVDDMSGSWGDTDKGIIKWEQCSMLRDKGFKDEAGQPVTVPVGDISDPHHSFCFRTFNMLREIDAHHYTLADARPKPPGDAFGKVVFQMQKDLEAPPPPPPAADASAPTPADAGTD